MKPYLAILIDSFWEAVSSRILWGLLVCWTVLLAGLAPFGYVAEVGYQLSRGDILNPMGLSIKLAKGLTPAGTAQQRALSATLSEGFKKRLTEANGKGDVKERNSALEKIGRRELAAELNKLLKLRDLYDADLFPSIANISEVKAIAARRPDERSELEVEQLNRQILRMTYSADLRSPRNEQIWFGYAGIKIGNQLPFDRSQINLFIEGIALQLIIRLGLSFVVVFVGLIITSSMIPDTFRSGSLHLLLSKPVSRALIYLTKVFGGMMFVLINITFLLVGLFLLVGWRLGIWNAGLLWCIPLLLFVFLIFYSVSALVGLIWNNPIICVVVCIVFWIFCLTVGALEQGMRMPAQWLPQIVRFAQVGDELLAITQSSEVNVWNDRFQVWQPAVDMNDTAPGRVLGPIHDAERGRMILRSDFLNGMGDFETRSRNFVLVDLTQPNEAPAAELESTAQASTAGSGEEKSGAPPTAADDNSIPKTVDEARRKPRWPSENGPEPPMGMLDLITLGGKTLAITRNGIFEVDWQAQEISEAAKSTPSIFGDFSNWLNRVKPQTFRDLSPTDYLFGDSVRVTRTPDQQHVVIYNSNRIDALRMDASSGRFVVDHSYKLEGAERRSALIAASDRYILVGRDNESLTLLDRELSKIIQSVPIPGESDPRQILVAGNSDRFSIVTHDDRLLELDGSTQSLVAVDCPWQGSITGVTWLEENKLWIGIRPNRAALLDRSTGKIERQLIPVPSRLDLFYNWIARPLYVVSPKPSSLNGVLVKLLQRDRAGQTQLFNNDLAAYRVEIEVWQPVISNLIFVAVLLALGCLYVWRKEF